MGLGNRRFVVLGVVAIGLALTLSGCSVSANTYASDPAAVAVGTQAIGFASSTSSPAPTGWRGTVPCPAVLLQNERAALPSGATLDSLDPATVTGVPDDPTLTQGDVPSCAFRLVETGGSADQLLFVGMTDDYASVIAKKLVSDGFTAGAVGSEDTGTKEQFTRGTAKVAIEHLTDGSIPVIVVVGG